MKRKFKYSHSTEDLLKRIEVLLQPCIKAKLKYAFMFYPELKECSHNAISEFIGSSRESVTKTMKKLCLILFAYSMFVGCGSSVSDCDPKANQVYSGPVYGGLVTITDKVNACMGKQGYPNVTIYDSDFHDMIGSSCILVHGSASIGGEIRLAMPSLEKSKGQLFAEEYVHYLGIKEHGHPCMNFTWD